MNASCRSLRFHARRCAPVRRIAVVGGRIGSGLTLYPAGRRLLSRALRLTGTAIVGPATRMREPHDSRMRVAQFITLGLVVSAVLPWAVMDDPLGVEVHRL